MMAGIIINHDVTVPKSDWKSQEAEKNRNQSVLGTSQYWEPVSTGNQSVLGTGHWDWSVFSTDFSLSGYRRGA